MDRQYLDALLAVLEWLMGVCALAVLLGSLKLWLSWKRGV